MCVGVAYAVAIGLGVSGMVGIWWWLPLLSLPLAIWLVRYVEPDRRSALESGAQADGPAAPPVRAAVRGWLCGWARAERSRLAASARGVTPERRALMCGEQTWTFAELDGRVDAAAAARARLALGSTWASGRPNSAGFVVAVHALMRLGAVLVPINTRLRSRRWPGSSRTPRSARVLRRSTTSTSLLQRRAPARRRTAATLTCRACTAIVYTSGTTGRPKGAILTYGNHWWSAVASALNLGLLADDSWLACLPLFHVGGLSILLRSVICGMAAVVHRASTPARSTAPSTSRRVSIVSVVSTMLDRMLTERGARPYPPTLRCVLLGGGPGAAAVAGARCGGRRAGGSDLRADRDGVAGGDAGARGSLEKTGIGRQAADGLRDSDRCGRGDLGQGSERQPGLRAISRRVTVGCTRATWATSTPTGTCTCSIDATT